jgi:tetratricopeptide (TPR) repeat protein
LVARAVDPSVAFQICSEFIRGNTKRATELCEQELSRCRAMNPAPPYFPAIVKIADWIGADFPEQNAANTHLDPDRWQGSDFPSFHPDAWSTAYQECVDSSRHLTPEHLTKWLNGWLHEKLPGHPCLAAIHHALSIGYLRSGRLPLAKDHIEQALEILNEALGSTACFTLEAQLHLALVHAKFHDVSEAKSLAEKAMAIAAETCGEESLTNLCRKRRYFEILQTLGESEIALKLAVENTEHICERFGWFRQELIDSILFCTNLHCDNRGNAAAVEYLKPWMKQVSERYPERASGKLALADRLTELEASLSD